MDQNTLKPGDYTIVQRQGYTKLHKLKAKGTLALGSFSVELDNVIGHKYHEVFQMKAKSGSKRFYTLEKVEQVNTVSQLNIEQSGSDNRNITVDGTSQTLTKEEIDKLRESKASNDIIEQLITNSKTFSSKTEYSQEKYLKKKEKKYCDYIKLRKPTIRLLAQMFYRQDPTKTLGIRVDDLSQILTYSNVQSDGNYVLYDSGTSGLMPAALLNAIGSNTSGRLIHMHPGNECQKNALMAMQFPSEQVERCINVNIYSVLRCYYQNKGSYCEETIQFDVEGKTTMGDKVNNDCATEEGLKINNTPQQTRKRKIEEESITKEESRIEEESNIKEESKIKEESQIKEGAKGTEESKAKELKAKEESMVKQGSKGTEESKAKELKAKEKETKHQGKETQDESLDLDSKHKDKKFKTSNDSHESTGKKPGWQLENEKACRILEEKADAMILTVKEHPESIVKHLLPFLKGGRNLIVFSIIREPLQDLFVYLKNRCDFLSIRVSNNFMRNYQVLPERTHPEVNMNTGGYILTATKLAV